LDDGDATLETPGFNSGNVKQSGIAFAGNSAFAALGTTLAAGPLPPNSTPEFLTIVTAGTQPTTLTFAGQYGNRGIDYAVSGSLTVPEPSSVMLAVSTLVLLLRRRSRNQK